MNFSTKTEYGLRAMSRLDKTGKKPASLAVIAKEEKISLAYLERLFAQLRKAGLIKAERGSKGGYYLAKPASKISVLEIVETLEGELLPYDCLKGKVCCHSKGCKVHPVWTKLYGAVHKTLKQMKLSSIM
jgi:Rrf2 family protein